MIKMKVLICNSKNWFATDSKLKKFLKIIEISGKEELSVEFLKKLKPDFIFFVHWNWIVSNEICDKYNCILFHAGPLPYGRGGSPIQNLIIKGFKHTPLCALKMVKELDAGPIYLKKKLSLSGSLTSIFKRMNKIVNELIFVIINKNIKPKAQVGEPTYFKRLSIIDNEIKKNIKLNEIYDKIRMIDHEEYPNAFIVLDNIKLEFYESKFKNETIHVKCKISKC